MSDTMAASRHVTGTNVMAAVLSAGVVVLLLPYLSGLIGALVLHVMALPLARRLDPAGRRWVNFVVVLGLVLLIVVPGAWLLAEVAAQLPDAVRQVGQSPGVRKILAWQVGEVALGSRVRDASGSMLAWTSRQTVTVIGGALSGLLNLVIAAFGAYYLLASGPALWHRVKGLLPMCPTTAEFLRIRILRVTEAMLIGVVLTGATQGFIVGITFAAIGLPNPLLWGSVTAAVSVLPMFGSGIVWGPAVLVLLGQQRFVAAAALAALGILVVSNIDNWLRLIVYRHVSQIHPMITLVGAFAGVGAFGLAGLLLGPLVLSFAIELLLLVRPSSPAAVEVAA